MGKNVIITAILIVLFFLVFTQPKVSEDKVIIKVDTLWQVKHDTVYRKGKNMNYKKLDISYKKLDTGYSSEKVNIQDTPFIVNDYNQVFAYSDTIKRDSNVFIINDTIFQNKIQSRGFIYNVAEKTVVVTNNINAKIKNQLFIGLVGDVRRIDNKVGVGVGVLYKKQTEVYTFSITANQFNVGFYKKIF